MDAISKDVRFGLRTLRANPGLTAIAVLSLALGIGANTAIFSFIQTILRKELPVRDPGTLVLFGEGKASGMWGGISDGPMDLYSWKQYRYFKARNTVFEDVLAEQSRSPRVYFTGAGENSTGVPEPANAALVSGNYFQVLGVHPAVGSFFDASADVKPGTSPYVVLSYAFWQRRYGRDPAVMGKPVRIGQRDYTIVGVAAATFAGLHPGRVTDLYLPISMQAELPGEGPALDDPLLQFAYLIGRLKPGVTLARAQAEINPLDRQILAEAVRESTMASPSDAALARKATVKLTAAGKGFSALRNTYDRPLEILMMVVALVLLIACANVANLLLGLSLKRRKEIAVRIAMGAGRARVARQLLTEGLLLSCAGGVLGVLGGAAIGKLLVTLISTGPTPLSLGFDLDWRVLVFTVGVSVFTGILFGAGPALRATRVDPNQALKEGKSSMAAPRRVAFGHALVAGQVALSLALLVVAGLLLRSFRNQISIDTGFDRENVLVFKLDSEASGHKEDGRLARVYREIETRIGRLPGVAANGVSMFSFNEGMRVGSFQAPGMKLADDVRITAENFVSPGYFSTVRVPILAGRGLNEGDTAAGPQVVVVSESFAREIFPGQSPIGRTIQFDGEKIPVQIIGIAKNAKTRSVQDKAKDLKVVYHDVYQYPAYMHDLAVRTTGDRAKMVAAVRETIASVDRSLPVRWTTTLADEVSDSLVPDRAIAQLTAAFAGLALLLSGIGLYGTISFSVARRTSEIGIRMALGAERVNVLRMVMTDAALLTAAGLAAGLPLALYAGMQLQSMLYGLSGFDVTAIAVSVITLAIVAAVAAWLPARRAAAVDPMTALRYE